MKGLNCQECQPRRWLSLVAPAALAAVVLLIPSYGAIAQRRSRTARANLTVGGITFKLPRGYRLYPGQPTTDSVLMYGRDKDGIFVAVSFGDAPSDLVKAGLRQLYPKESESYSWKELPAPKKISKFESSATAKYGYNQNHLVKLVFHNVTVSEKNIVIGEIIEVSQGEEARRMFDESLEAISLGLCNAFVQMIFPLTKEKIDPQNPPCELIADIETSSPPKP